MSDGRITSCPVGAQQRDVVLRERLLHGVGIEHQSLVDLTGHAPRRREIDEDRAAGCSELQNALRGVVLPRSLVCHDRLGRRFAWPRRRADDRCAHHDRRDKPRERSPSPAPRSARPPRLPGPERNGDQQQHGGEPRHRIVVELRAEHPGEPDHRCVKREGQDLLQTHHPWPRRRQVLAPSGKERQQRIRQRHAHPERGEHREGRRSALREAVADRGAHERRRAWRGDRDGEHAGERVVDECVARAPGRERGRQELTDLEHAREIEREHEKQHRQPGNDRGRLKLEAPAELCSARAKREEEPRQQPERNDHPAAERKTVRARRAGVEALGRESEYLERKHREHAGHQIEQDASDERDAEREITAGRYRRRGDRHRRGPGWTGDNAAGERHIDRRSATVAESLGGSEDARNARELADALARHRQCQLQRRTVTRERLGRARFDLAFVEREEMHLTRIRSTGPRSQCEVDLAAASGRGDIPTLERPRQRAARACDRSRPPPIGLRVVGDRQRQRQVRALGNADFLAYQPVRACIQGDRPAAQEIRNGDDVGQKQDLALVTIIGQRSLLQRARRRPLDRPGGKSVGQLPGKCGRQSGFARVLPIRVPASLHRQAQRDRQRAARRKRGLLGYEFRLDVRGAHRRSHCRQSKRRSNKAANEAASDDVQPAQHDRESTVLEAASLGCEPRERFPRHKLEFYPSAPQGSALDAGALLPPDERPVRACGRPSPARAPLPWKHSSSRSW